MITDPDLPEQVAQHLADELPEHLGDDREWAVEVDVDPVTAGEHSTRDMLRATADRRQERGWDYAITLTDLPVRVNRRPVVADANLDGQVAVVSLPALGGTQPYRRSRQVVLQLVDELTGREGGADPVSYTHLTLPTNREV